MMATKSVRELATEALESFTTTKRNDEYIVTKREDAPEWVSDLVYEAHVGMLPDDWRYNVIRAALEHIASTDEPEDDASEFADDQVGVYTAERFAWLASNINRASYCDEAANEGLMDPEADTEARIGAGQYMEASEVYASVLESLEDAAR